MGMHLLDGKDKIGLQPSLPMESPPHRPVNISKRVYNEWHAPLMACFSKPFYRDVAYRWQGCSLKYMLALSAFTWLLVWFCTVLTPAWRLANNEQLIDLLHKLPPMALECGRLEIKERCP